MHSLPIFVRLAGRPVILIGDGDAAAAKRILLERAGAVVVEETAQAALAIVAVAAPEETVARLKARGILVNAVDRPDLCDFTLPAIVDRDPVLIAIGTGGASAGLAKALRQRLELLLPTKLGTLAKALAKARDALRARWPSPVQRREAIDAALQEAGPLDPLADNQDVSAWLNAATSPDAAVLYELHLRSDDPDDLSLRDARMLARAELVIHEAGIPQAILARARADAVRVRDTDTQPAAQGLTVRIVRG